jgi:hypothetical protein
MSRYLLSRKQVDILVENWGKAQLKGQNKESLPMFIRNQQALYMANELLNDGILGDKLEKLRQELELDN